MLVIQFIRLQTKYDFLGERSHLLILSFPQTTSEEPESLEVANDSVADNPEKWMYSLVYGMSLIAILLFFTTRSVLLVKV